MSARKLLRENTNEFGFVCVADGMQQWLSLSYGLHATGVRCEVNSTRNRLLFRLLCVEYFIHTYIWVLDYILHRIWLICTCLSYLRFFHILLLFHVKGEWIRRKWKIVPNIPFQFIGGNVYAFIISSTSCVFNFLNPFRYTYFFFSSFISDVVVYCETYSILISVLTIVVSTVNGQNSNQKQ